MEIADLTSMKQQAQFPLPACLSRRLKCDAVKLDVRIPVLVHPGHFVTLAAG
jgi:hypothetical protein